MILYYKINLLSKTYDSVKNIKSVNQKWKGVTSEKIKVFPLCVS